MINSDDINGFGALGWKNLGPEKIVANEISFEVFFLFSRDKTLTLLYSSLMKSLIHLG